MQAATPRPRRGALPTAQVLAYGLTMLGSTALHSCFMTYYVDAFRGHFHVSASSFVWAQLVFGAWNAVNDPLFGIIADSASWMGSTPLGRRGAAIGAGGLVWSAAFLAVWWPWGPGSSEAELAHMVFSLCAYDGALTWVEVNHGAALAEMTRDQGDRARANAWAGVCACVGALASWAAHVVWTRDDGLRSFRLVAAAVAVVSCAAFWASAYGIANTGAGLHAARTVPSAARRPAAPEKPGPARLPWTQALEFGRRLLASRSFCVFALVAGLQSFDCAFEKNFFGTFLERVAGGAASGVPPEARAGVVSLSFLLPHVITVALTPAIRSLGLFDVLNRILWVRMAFLGAAAVAVLLAGTGLGAGALARSLTSGWAPSAFLLVNRVSSECVCRLFPVVIGDLTDEAVAGEPQRGRQRAATVVGSAMLLGRLMSCAAPLAGFALVRAAEAGGGASLPLLATLCGVPLACVSLQVALWPLFPLKGERLREIKAAAAKADHTDDVTV